MPLHPPEVFYKRLNSDRYSRIDVIGSWAAAITYTNKMVNIGISGEPGNGKSTLAIEIGARIDKEFDLEKNIAYTRREVIEKAYKLPKHSVLIVDEAIGAHKRRAMEAAQKDIIEMINKIRYKNHVIIWNLPIFTQLDKDLRVMFDLWIHVAERGKAAVFRKNRNILAEDPWIPKQWLFRWQNRAVRTPEEQWQMLRSHPLYEFTLHFPPLPKRLQYIYDRFSEEAKSRLEREESAKKHYLRLLGTNNGNLVKAYLANIIVIGALLRDSKIGVTDLERAFKEYWPRPVYLELVKDLTHNAHWYPPDPRKYAMYVLKKFDQFVGED